MEALSVRDATNLIRKGELPEMIVVLVYLHPVLSRMRRLQDELLGEISRHYRYFAVRQLGVSITICVHELRLRDKFALVA